jgi:hypothetical protein
MTQTKPKNLQAVERIHFYKEGFEEGREYGESLKVIEIFSELDKLIKDTNSIYFIEQGIIKLKKKHGVE